VLDINTGRVTGDLKSQGFNYAYRRTGVAQTQSMNAVAAPNPPVPSSAATFAPPAPAANAVPKTPVTSEPKTPISETTSPAALKDKELHGNGSASAMNERAEQKKKERKEKEKEKRERQRAEREKEKQQQVDKAAPSSNTEANASAKAPTPKGSGKATPDPAGPSATDGPAAVPKIGGPEGDPTSPVLSGAESSGAQTPRSQRPARNPWTLFIKLPAPVSEQELRDFFLEAKEGITKVNMPPSNFGRGRVAYVEFGDEEAMKEGLTKHAEVSSPLLTLIYLAHTHGPLTEIKGCHHQCVSRRATTAQPQLPRSRTRWWLCSAWLRRSWPDPSQDVWSRGKFREKSGFKTSRTNVLKS
jgi:hypothetical protein